MRFVGELSGTVGVRRGDFKVRGSAASAAILKIQLTRWNITSSALSLYGKSHLGLSDDQFRCPSYFLMLEHFDSEVDLVATAHLVYAAYATHNTLRHSSPTPSSASTLACLRRFTQSTISLNLNL